MHLEDKTKYCIEGKRIQNVKCSDRIIYKANWNKMIRSTLSGCVLVPEDSVDQFIYLWGAKRKNFAYAYCFIWIRAEFKKNMI